MSKANEHGGEREGAGRKRKTESEKARIRCWYGLVCDAAEYDRSNQVAGLWAYIKQDIKGRWPQPVERKDVFGKEEVRIGTKPAWYGYQKGERYPDKEFCANIDRYIVARNNLPENSDKLLPRHPIRWVLSRPGELSLTPLWGWSPFECDGVPEKEILFAAKVHAKFYERIPPDRVFPVLQDILLSVQDDPRRPHDYKWPPILLLPKLLADSCTTLHPDLPLPYLLEESPPANRYVFGDENGPAISDEEKLREFAEWSMSTYAKASPSMTWLQEIPTYLRPIFFMNDPEYFGPYFKENSKDSTLHGDIQEYAESISPSCVEQLFSSIAQKIKRINDRGSDPVQ